MISKREDFSDGWLMIMPSVNYRVLARRNRRMDQIALKMAWSTEKYMNLGAFFEIRKNIYYSRTIQQIAYDNKSSFCC